MCHDVEGSKEEEREKEKEGKVDVERQKGGGVEEYVTDCGEENLLSASGRLAKMEVSSRGKGN